MKNAAGQISFFSSSEILIILSHMRDGGSIRWYNSSIVDFFVHTHPIPCVVYLFMVWQMTTHKLLFPLSMWSWNLSATCSLHFLQLFTTQPKWSIPDRPFQTIHSRPSLPNDSFQTIPSKRFIPDHPFQTIQHPGIIGAPCFQYLFQPLICLSSPSSHFCPGLCHRFFHLPSLPPQKNVQKTGIPCQHRQPVCGVSLIWSLFPSALFSSPSFFVPPVLTFYSWPWHYQADSRSPTFAITEPFFTRYRSFVHRPSIRSVHVLLRAQDSLPRGKKDQERKGSNSRFMFKKAYSKQDFNDN